MIDVQGGKDDALTILQKEITIQGSIIGTGTLKIFGKIKGNIEVQGNCDVEIGGRVEGDIKANVIKIKGALVGNANAENSMEILETGSVEGDITVPRISIADGAMLNGRVNVKGKFPTSDVKKSDYKL